ncbi:MAG: hypothetical protein WKF77_04115 [Planctomycetaceae bacterium]
MARSGQQSADAVSGGPAGRAGCAAQVLETTALGAAYLAGLAAGFWKNKRDIEGVVEG